MRYDYTEFDGQPFQTPDSLFPSSNVMEFILQHGDQAMDALDALEDGDEAYDLVEEMIAAGLMERDDQTGKLKLTPKMLRGIQHRALLEVFEGLRQGRREGHQTTDRGRSDERGDGVKPYQFGDPLHEVDVAASMRNALRRAHQGTIQGTMLGTKQGTKQEGLPLPLSIQPDDFELHVTEGQTDVAMCMLIDLSGSMMRWGRFYQAKRIALGMSALMRSRFPQDTLDFVGFYSLASPIAEKDVPLVMPKPVSIHDPRVRLRVPLDKAMTNEERIPQHFTNLQLGLRQARQILSRRGAANKQIFIITDGQPTAHVAPAGELGESVEAGQNAGDEMLYLLYPPTEQTASATLKEALRCQQQGIRLATFALIEDYWGMDWVNFVEKLTRLTRGTAFYCTSEDLSSTVVESYLSGRKKKSFVG